ncbi:hypothetical protein PTW37_15640 [Arthrobacter agilis]|uniref:hypothetical protein n=1 Tax=Arthrobacter agilis TaxID=37921 RepID=UPI00236578F8|nr:hypothetical protein [Arthrobacter agilis]WDF33260.1 hypothetical protein PTW37_15640 [Arthrobacter agilis]
MLIGEDEAVLRIDDAAAEALVGEDRHHRGLDGFDDVRDAHLALWGLALRAPPEAAEAGAEADAVVESSPCTCAEASAPGVPFSAVQPPTATRTAQPSAAARSAW